MDAVLETPERIAQHTRIFRYIDQRGLVAKLAYVRVRLADGAELPLVDIRRRAQQGGIGVFFGVAQKQALNQIMQARGHIVVLLSGDGHRQQAERSTREILRGQALRRNHRLRRTLHGPQPVRDTSS